jgi:putative hydrolase of the HAD superfamily
LIIFDLDDTLIDTSGAITPFKLKECLDYLVSMGLKVGSYQELSEMNEKSARAKEAVSAFVKKYGGSPDLAALALEKLSSPLPEGFLVPTTPNAKEILEFFKDKAHLALVTAGNDSFQREKLKKAGIEPSIFSNMAIPENGVKKPFYKGFLTEFSVPPDQVWVCGDRPSVDLRPAHELGMKTIHMRWGRGATAKTEEWIDYTISDLSELKRIIG